MNADTRISASGLARTWALSLPLCLSGCFLFEDDEPAGSNESSSGADSTTFASTGSTTAPFGTTHAASEVAGSSSEASGDPTTSTETGLLTSTSVTTAPDQTTGDTEVDVPPPPPHFVLECGAPEAATADVLADWEADELAHPLRTRGHVARFALAGLPLYVEEGPIRAAIPGGFCDLEFDASDGVYLFVEATAVAATAEGQAPRELGPGLVVLRASGRNQGSGMRLDHVELEEIAGLSARLDPQPVPVIREANHTLRGMVIDTDERMAPSSSLPQEMMSAQASARRMASGSVAIEVEHPVLPYFVGADGVGELLGPETVLLQLEGGDGAFLSTRRPYTLLPDQLSLRLEGEGRFALSSDFTGLVEIDELGYPRAEDLHPPVAIFGTESALTISQSGEVTGTARVTQALDDAGLLIEARVQMASTSIRVELEPEEKVLQTLNVREASFAGDGLVGNVTMIGDWPEGMVELRADTVPSFVRIFEIVDDAGWVGAPTLAVIATVGAVSLFVGETFKCVFTFGFGCDFGAGEGFDSYDTIAPAGEVDDFELAINGVGDIGDVYRGTLRFEGQNYCPVEIDVEVEIVCRPSGAEVCSDSLDNDCNGLSDCEDPACTGLPCDPERGAAVCDAAGICV